jgi:hypothetical protein
VSKCLQIVELPLGSANMVAKKRREKEKEKEKEKGG